MRPLLLLFFLLSGMSILSAQQKNKIFLVGDVLSKAGKQRMLTQRMGRCYIGMYLGLEVATNQEEMTRSMALFEKQLNELSSIKVNGRYLQHMHKVGRLWTAYKNLLESRPTKENLEQLLLDNTLMLEACELVVYDLVVYASRFSEEETIHQMNKSIVNLENMAGRQRMLTERTLFYFLANQAILDKKKGTKEELKKILGAYDNALLLLMGAIENTPEIDYRLTLLSNEWKIITKSCLIEVEDITQIEAVLKLGKELLNEMEEITTLYEELIDIKVASLLLNNAIDMAGKQSILTQKMLKSYLLLGIEKDKKHQHVLETFIQEFEEHIDALKLFAPMEEITAALNIVDNLWTNYRNHILETPTKSGAQTLLHTNNELLRSCDNVVMLLEMYGKIYKKSISRYNSNMAHWINQVGHQEMLTERILMYSNAIYWGVEGIDLAAKLEEVGLYQARIHRMVSGAAINKANNQCLLSQKIATSYLAIGMELNLNYYQQQLKKDKLLFQKQLEELKSFANSSELKKNLGEINQYWNVYQVIFTGKITKEKLPQLLEVSQEMLIACEKVVEQINKESFNDRIHGIDKAAHLRTMTEQILLFSLTERWTGGDYQKEREEALVRFDEYVQLLANQQTNSIEMTKSINAISRYHKRLTSNCNKLKEVDLYRILLLHDMLLLETEKLTNAYEEGMVF